MLERVIGSVLVGWCSFFNRGNQGNFRTDQLQERVKKTHHSLLLVVVTKPKKILADCFSFNPRKRYPPKSHQKNIILLDPSEMVFYPINSSFTGTEEPYLLITWFCHPCDTMHAEVPPDDPEHFCPFWRLASFVALKKNVFRLDRLLGREQRGLGLGDVCCLEFRFLKKLRKVKMFKVWDDSSQKTFTIFNTWKENNELKMLFLWAHHTIWSKIEELPFRLTRSSQEDPRPILTSAVEQRERFEAHL